MVLRRPVAIALAGLGVVATLGLSSADAATVPESAAVDVDRGPVVTSSLDAVLDASRATARVNVFVNADDLADSLSAVEASGLVLRTTFDRVGTTVATGTPAQVRLAASQPGVVRVEWADQPVRLDLDRSHSATRADEAAAAFRTVDDLPYDGTGIGIMVLDSGVDGTHPMFAAADGTSRVKRNLEALPLQDVVSGAVVDDLDGDNDTDDTGGHGTHVTSIAGGSKVTTGKGREIQGAAPGADLYAISTATGASSLYGMAAASYWTLENHAEPCGPDRPDCAPIKVVNNSWGGNAGEEFDAEATYVEIQRGLIADGVVVVRSTGNSGGDGNGSTVTGGYKIDPMPGVITVANYDDLDSGTRDGAINSSSSRGDKADPFTWPDIAAPGTNIEAACRPEHNACTPVYAEFDEDLQYSSLTGTSMSAPHISGYVAVLLQANPALTPGDVEFLLEETAYKMAGDGEYTEIPRRFADDASGNASADDDGTITSSYERGAGLVDVTAALAAALGLETPEFPDDCAGYTVIHDAPGDAAVLAAILAEPVGEGLPTPDVDVVAVTADERSADARVRLAIYVSDLGEQPVGGGDAVRSFFTAGGTEFTLDMSRRLGADADTGEAGYVLSGSLSTPDPEDPTGVQNVTVDNTFPVVFDAVNDVAYADLRIEDLGVGVDETINAFRTLWRRSGGAVALPADEAVASCPLLIGTNTDFLDPEARIG